MKKAFLFCTTVILFISDVYAQRFEWVINREPCTRGNDVETTIIDAGNNLINEGMANCCLFCPITFMEKIDASGNLVYRNSYIADPATTIGYPNIEIIGTDAIGSVFISTTFTGNAFEVRNSITNLTYPVINSSAGATPWNAIIKLNSNGGVAWYNVLSQNSNGAAFVIPSGTVYCGNGSVYDTNGNLLSQGGTVFQGQAQYNNGNIISINGNTISRLSIVNGQVLSSFTVPYAIQAIELDAWGDIYIGDSVGLKKYNTSNSLVWSSNIGSVNDLSSGPQFAWVALNEASLPYPVIIKINKTTGVIQLSESLINSTNARVAAINDDEAYVVSGLSTIGGSPSSYVLWNPLITLSGPFSSGYIAGLYSCTLQNTVLNFSIPFWSPYASTNGWVYASPPWPNPIPAPCPGGTAFPVAYQLSGGTFGPGAQVFAELSDASGSFANPVVIGSDIPSGSQDTINCQLPSTTVGGYPYRIRLTSTSPILTSIQVSGDLGISANPPLVSASGPTTFCAGDSVVLTVTNSSTGNPLLWSTGDTTASITVKSDGNYFASFPSGGCTYSSPSITVNAEPNLIDIDTIDGPAGIVSGQAYSYSVVADTNATSYNWVTACGTVVNGQGTNNALVFWLTTTPCPLTVYVSNAACADSAAITIYPLTGTQETATASPLAYLFPNPVKEMLNVRFSIPNSSHLIELMDVQGRLMERREVVAQSTVVMNTDALAAGTYFLKVKRNEETATMMFIKQ